MVRNAVPSVKATLTSAILFHVGIVSDGHRTLKRCRVTSPSIDPWCAYSSGPAP
jgi:hypothetical protein